MNALIQIKKQLTFRLRKLKRNLDNSKRTRILFVHIPRTGGTTVEAVMRQRLPGEFFEGYYDGSIIRSNPAKLKRADYFIGHNYYQIRKLIPEPNFAFTFLRDPIDRAYSLWTYMLEKGEYAHHGDFMNAVLKAHYFSNHQTRFLARQYRAHRLRENFLSQRVTTKGVIDDLRQQKQGEVTEVEFIRAKAVLDELQFVGVFSHLQADIAELFFKWGVTIELPIPHERKTKKHKTEVISVTEEDIQIIKEKNQWDIKLYQYAEQLRKKRHLNTG